MTSVQNDEEIPLLGAAKAQVKQFGSGFKEFIMKGSIIDLAVAFIIGGAFQAIVTSLVNDILMPPIGLIGGNNMENLFAVIKGGNSGNNTYPTLAAAADDMAVTLNYGRFIQKIVYFLIVALILYLMILTYQKGKKAAQLLASKLKREYDEIMEREAVVIEEAEPAPTEKECPQCCKMVPIKAKKCCFCTSVLTPEGVEGDK